MSSDVTDDNIEDIGVDDDADVTEYRGNGNIHGYYSSIRPNDSVFVLIFPVVCNGKRNLIGIDGSRSRRDKFAEFNFETYLGRMSSFTPVLVHTACN